VNDLKMPGARVCVAIVIVLTCGVSRAAPPQRDHDLKPEDYFTIGAVTSVAVSPNGQFVAYTESRWQPPEERRNVDLWVVEHSTGSVQRLTFDDAADQSPRWSPDSTHIYFKSGRKRAGEESAPYNGKPQVWRVAREGGEPRAVTRVQGGVGLFDLAGDGKALYYTTSEKTDGDEWKALKKKFDKLEYGDATIKNTKMWRLDLINWRAVEVLDQKRIITSLDVAADESRIAMVTRPDTTLLTAEGWSRVDVYDAASETVETVTKDGWRDDHDSPYGWIDTVKITGGGEAVAWTVSFDGYPTRVYVAEWDRGSEKPTVRDLPRPPLVSAIGGTIQWRGDSRDLCYIGDERARSRVYCARLFRNTGDPAFLAQTHGDVVVHGYGFDKTGGVLAVNMSRPTHARDVFIVEASEQYRRLTSVNPQMARWKLPQTSIVSWTGADGDTVEGILELPPDYDEGDGPLPLVVEIHGGPTAATHYQLRFWIYGRSLMPAQGYALLSPNYRGSTGYGDEFMVELIGRENDIEVEDILTGVDAMVERGIADPDRLAVMGWSNGGYLTNCLITRSDRFKAASSGAGVVDQVIQWAIEDTPGHVINYMKSLPWENKEAFVAGSPLYELHKVKTPTLIHVGEHDERVPAAHARTLYRALRRYLDVPSELIVYPGEGHGLTTYTHRKAKMKWDLAWFEKYLNPPTPEPDNTPASGDTN